MGLINVAAGKRATVSSVAPFAKFLKPGSVLGRQPATPFGFHTNVEDSPWWRVDLGWLYPVCSIIVQNRSNACQERARSMSVEVSVDGLVWTTLREPAGDFGGGGSGSPLIIELSSSVLARHVRLQLHENVALHLSHVGVFVQRELLSDAEQAKSSTRKTMAVSSRKLAVSVIGTSNSLMEYGYTSALNSDAMELRYKACVGASHAVLVPHLLHEIPSATTDVLLVDFSVDEQRAAQRGLFSARQSEQLMMNLLAWCAETDIVPIVVIMPSRSLQMSRSRGLFPEIDSGFQYVKLCQRFGVPYFDGYRFVDALANGWSRSPESLFKDEAHLNNPAAQALGRALGDEIQKLFSRVSTPSMSTAERTVQVHHFESVPLSAATQSHVVIQERASSIRQADMVRLVSGENLEVQLGQGSTISGIVLNMSQSNASLAITGDSTLVKNLDSTVFDPDKDLWLAAWSLFEEPHSLSGEFHLEVLESDSAHEANDHGHETPKAPTSDAGVLEISHLIVKYASVARKIRSISGIELDLVRNVLSTDSYSE